MPAKIARLATWPPFWIPEVSVAVRSSRPSCSNAEKRRIFMADRQSSGESRSVGISESKSGIGSVFPICSADGYAAVTRLTNAFLKKFENDWHAKRGPYKKRIAA
jgi:hypothetical protein